MTKLELNNQELETVEAVFEDAVEFLEEDIIWRKANKDFEEAENVAEDQEPLILILEKVKKLIEESQN